MLPTYFFIYAQVLFISVFTLSALSKLRTLDAFEDSIVSFGMVPQAFVKPLTRLIILAEISVVVLMPLGVPSATIGFGIALVLLVVFSGALLRALLTDKKVDCNCFGASGKLVSRFDMVRNVCLVVFAISPLVILANTTFVTVSVGEIALIGFLALMLMLVLVHLAEIASIFKQPIIR